MTQEHQAADALRKFARLLEPVSEAINVLDRLGSLKQAEDEAMVALDALNAKRAEAVKELGEVQAQLKELHEQQEAAMAQVKAHAQEMIDMSERQAEHIREQASTSAAAIMQRATNEAALIRADAERMHKAAQDGANANIEAAAAARKEVAEAKAQADAFKAQIAAERERMAALLRG